MSQEEGLLSFGGHLEVLRQMLFRILGVTFVFSCIIFCFKEKTFDILLAPSNSSFITYCSVENLINKFNPSFHFDDFNIDLIATDLSSQFVTHLTTSVYLGLLCASPLVMYELFRFVSPALLENERRYSTKIVISIYVLFLMGVMMSYYVLFPISFRFLGTYSVANKVQTMVTLDSYISTFVSLTLLMGIVFQLPVIAFILAKMGVLTPTQMAKYRKHAFILIMLIAAIITPPDILTLILVSVPLYALYECSTLMVSKCKLM
ncbi:MAG: twin-arginine translocase subunit TatC [Pseudoflavonifractor sp.]|nr:twin-arginine translocase subunit TatC [Pseudoflavonifractor sp.]